MTLPGKLGKLRTKAKHPINVDHVRYHRSRYEPET